MSSLLVLIPFLCIIILNLPFRAIMRPLAFWVVAILTLIQVYVVGFRPQYLEISTFNLTPFFAFGFSIDSLTTILLLAIGIIVFITLIIARFSIDDEHVRFNFINLLLIVLIGMNALTMASDIFSLYVYIELVAISSFVLIALKKERLALEAAFKYIIISAVATTLMLASIALLIMVCAGTSFTEVTVGLASAQGAFIARVAVGLFLCGLFVKAGIVPFHGWLPDAYSASPTFVSVLLAGIVTKAYGVYVLMRLAISVFGYALPIDNILMFVGALSIVIGALAALTQSDFKRMLAYSSISQVGYIIIGLGCATPLAIAGAAFHLFNHAIFKSLLFVNAAALERQLGTTDMDTMGGLGSKMPVTSTTSIIGMLSTAGAPPLAGFWSKLMIVVALFTSGNNLYGYIALLASVLTLAYFLSLQRRVFFGNLKAGFENIREARLGIIAPALLLAILTVGIGLAFPLVLNNWILPVMGILR